MSDQSPWGTPPPNSPNNPYGAPGQPPPPAQPPYYGGPGYPGPQGPQPPKKRTGLIVGIVVAVVLLVAAAFAVTLVVVSGDDDEPGEASSSTTASETSEPTEDPPTDAPSTDATDSPTDGPTDGPSTDGAPPSDGDTITGDGYTYRLPAAGWKDASEDAKGLAATIDTAIILGASIDLSQSSIIVEALSAGPATTVEDLEDLWKRNLSSSDNATPEDIDEITLDGERAIGVRIEDRVNNSGVPITQVAYLALHDGRQYSIGLSFPKEGDTVSEDDFQTMLDSWAWTS